MVYKSAFIMLLFQILHQSDGDLTTCFYSFEGIQNSITYGLNVDNTDTIFKFTILNQTGHAMSNKHAKMITEYSRYYGVSDDYLKLKTCPYPGLVEDLEFGIEEEISCNINISVIAYAAISELSIPREVVVRIDGQTQEYEIIVYQLQLNATEECATYGCTIDCRNDNNQYFRAATAGNKEEHKSLFFVYTTPYSIRYSPFAYELSFACNDINYPGETLVTTKANFTFIDTSVTSSTDSSTSLLSTVPETKLLIALTSYVTTTIETEVQSTSRKDLTPFTSSVKATTPYSSVARILSTTGGMSTLVLTNKQNDSDGTNADILWMYSTAKNTSSLQRDVFQSIISTQPPRTHYLLPNTTATVEKLTFTHFSETVSPTVALSTASSTSSRGSIKRETTPINEQFITSRYQRNSPNRITTVYSGKIASADLKTTSVSRRFLNVTGSLIFETSKGNYYTTSTFAKNTTRSSGSFFDKPANVVAFSTVAGVAAMGAVGTGAYALASKRCDVRGDKNEKSEETKKTDSTGDEVHTQHEN